MGQQITLSLGWSAIYNGVDTDVNSLMDTPCKLVVWHDSLACGICEVSRMFKWDELVADVDSMSQWFSIIFLFTPPEKDMHILTTTLKDARFNYPVFIDQNATFVEQNQKLPKNSLLHTFLLDKNNKVVLVGSPLHNPVLWELYKSTIWKMIENDGVLPE
ncbi:MAG: hypothetical protein LBC84_03385 [Prevotellaceae bacterium]|jgi:hypothetical protein|nr:hypothetical protein [Prevotellaceae bacterium]